jgi:hypothetical protein
MMPTEEREVVWEIVNGPELPAIAIRFEPVEQSIQTDEHGNVVAIDGGAAPGTPIVSINRHYTIDLALERRTLPNAIAQAIEQALTNLLLDLKAQEGMR